MPSHAARRAAVLLVALGAVVAAPLPAQSQPSSVPTPLVVALLGHGGPGESDSMRISVGRAPESFAAALLPPAPATVVGGLSRGGRDGAVVLAYPSPADSALASYVAFLQRAGFKGQVQGKGFQPDSPPFGVLCGDSTLIHVRVAPGAASGSHLVVSPINFARPLPCESRAPVVQPVELPFPKLREPTGAQTRFRGNSSDLDGRSTTTTLVTRMSIGELLAHYGDQLAQAGWTVGRPLADGAVGMRVLSARDVRGVAWHGALTVIEQADARHVTLRMGREVTGDGAPTRIPR